jgi:hypothetical protein
MRTCVTCHPASVPPVTSKNIIYGRKMAAKSQKNRLAVSLLVVNQQHGHGHLGLLVRARGQVGSWVACGIGPRPITPRVHHALGACAPQNGVQGFLVLANDIIHVVWRKHTQHGYVSCVGGGHADARLHAWQQYEARIQYCNKHIGAHLHGRPLRQICRLRNLPAHLVGRHLTGTTIATACRALGVPAASHLKTVHSRRGGGAPQQPVSKLKLG